MFDIKSTHNNKTLNINIPNEHKVVCVSVSGGADSALMLWHLLNYQKETNNRFKLIIYTTGGRNRTYFNFYHSLKVQQWIFKHTKFDHDYTWCTFKQRNTNTARMYSHMKVIAKKFGATLFVSGRTGWPPEDELEPYWTEGQTIGWDGYPISEAEAKTYQRSKFGSTMENIVNEDPDAIKWFTADTYYYTPMISVDKKWIWGSYKYYDIEDLWNTTRSCEGKQAIFDKACGECWWCLERNWARS